MYLLVRGARGETLLRLPVHVQRRGRVVRELLLALTRGRVPDDRRPAIVWLWFYCSPGNIVRSPVHSRTQNEVPGLVPLESEDGPLVLAQGLLLLPGG